MSDSTATDPAANRSELREIDAALAAGPAVAIDALIARFRADKDYDRLFDALVMKARLDLGLSLVSPTRFDDVPEDQLVAFEEGYVAAAREVGRLLLADGKLPRAWTYYRTIREPGPVAAALDAIDPQSIDYETAAPLIDTALHEGANRVAGLWLLLATHGTCNTVSMADQVLPAMTPDERRQAAALLVRDVYGTLVAALRRDVEMRTGTAPPSASVRALLSGRDDLFDDANYHVDVSHLHAVVRFARGLTKDDPELPLAIELAEYGSRLAPQFRYPSDPPFDDYYPSHLAYLRAVGDLDRNSALAYFHDRLKTEPDPRDRQLTAYVLVDLLLRCERLDEAAEVAAAHLSDLEEPGGFSFASLCRRAGRLDLLKTAAERNGDPLRYVAAAVDAGWKTGV